MRPDTVNRIIWQTKRSFKLNRRLRTSRSTASDCHLSVDMGQGQAGVRWRLQIALISGFVAAIIVLTMMVGRKPRRELLSLPLPVEPQAHPRLRAIARVPRSHGYKDAVDFATLPTVSSKVVTNRLVDSKTVAKKMQDALQAKTQNNGAGGHPKLGFGF